MSGFLMKWCGQREKKKKSIRETYCGWTEIAELVRALLAALVPPSHFSRCSVCSPATHHKFWRSSQPGTRLTFHFCALDSEDRRSGWLAGG